LHYTKDKTLEEKMRRIDVDSIKKGAKLARSIFSSDGGVLLAEGITLDERYIEVLKNRGITQIYIEDEISKGIEVKDAVKEETRNEAVVLVKNMMTGHKFISSPEIEEVKATVEKIIGELLRNNDIVYSLSDIKSLDDYTFQHSVNVCILSTITGISLGFGEERLKELAVGAILHDIGKMCISKEILHKPGQLTISEFEEIKKHTVYGYEMLRKNDNLGLASAYIAFGHHERYDGSGYPLQLKGNNIEIYCRIVAVADVYDALTSDRVYRKRLRPNEVYEYITSLGVNHFDPKVVENFVKFVSIYPVGTGVMLNTRERALVIKDNRDAPTKPVVRIIHDDDSGIKRIYKEIDLSKQTSLFIIGGCDI